MLLRLQRSGYFSLASAQHVCKFATQVVTEGVQKVSAQIHTPQQLEDNLSELELLLADKQVQADTKLWNTNQTSLKTLQTFLKDYTAKLNNPDTEFLERQRHTLEFIIRDAEKDTSLKRVVCKLGTTGGDCHRLVHRTLQGLFREVGLSPNIVWDKSFSIRVEHLTSEQRAQLEDAKLEAIKDQIVAAQQGKPAPANAPLKVADENDRIGNIAVQSHEEIVAGQQQQQQQQDQPGTDSREYDSEVDEDVHDSRRIQELETGCNHLAMKPWIDVSQTNGSEDRSSEELLMHFLSVGLNLRPLMDRVWAGDREMSALVKEFSSDEAYPHYVPEQLVMQIADCSRLLTEKFGVPDAGKPVPFRKLVMLVRSVHHLVLEDSSSSDESSDDEPSDKK